MVGMPEQVLSLPFEGRWLVQNSPARRVPSHGTDMLGQRYAIDFVGVDEKRRTAFRRDWRTFLATEPPERFVAFGRPILAPGDGVVIAVHDGEVDHEARRTPLTLVPYMFGQQKRFRQGGPAGHRTSAGRAHDLPQPSRAGPSGERIPAQGARRAGRRFRD